LILALGVWRRATLTPSPRPAILAEIRIQPRLPLITLLERLKAKATAQTYYQLFYRDKRKIKLMSWPYHQIPLDQLENFKRLADFQKKFGKNSENPGDYTAIYQKLPEEFIGQLPGTFAMNNSGDQNRDVYFTAGGKIFRVTYNAACTSKNPYCGDFNSVSAAEVVSPEAALAKTIEDFENPSGTTFYSGFVGAWLWPRNVAPNLKELSSDGRVITSDEFENHKLFYFELLVSGGHDCSGGVDFIEGEYKYEKVSVCQKGAKNP